MITIIPIPILEDNYAYYMEAADGTIAVLDPGESEIISRFIDARGGRLDYILNTHHHYDHTDGNSALKEKYQCPVVGPAADAHRIPGLDIGLTKDDVFMLGTDAARIFETPGHTTGHICFYFEDSRALFCGDVVFSLGCGRLFEGTPEIMWQSFQTILALPDDTQLYGGHEYTLENGAFCLTIEPDNQALRQRIADARALRDKNLPTYPTTLAQEKATNCMLRAGSAAQFAERRHLKDNFD